MYNFPDTLYPEPQKMFWDDSMGFGFPEGNTIFYSRYDGNWSDIGLWEAVNGSKRLPGAGDVVYVRHTVVANITTSVKHLFVSGTLKANGSPTLSILGNIKSTGMIDFTASGINLILYGLDNYINSFTSGTSTVNYANNYQQTILPLEYYTLTITKLSGIFQPINFDLTTKGNFNIYGALVEMSAYNLSVLGTTNIGIGNIIFGGLSKSGSGSILFKGLLTISFNKNASLLLAGNPNVEFQNGIAYSSTNVINTGTGNWKFTTNNQSIYTLNSNTLNITSPVIIDGITLTIGGLGAGLNIVAFNSIIDGTNALSKLVNKAWIQFNSPSIVNIMATNGSYDINTFAGSGIIYNFNDNFVLPFVSFVNLTLNGTGTKTELAATNISETLSLSSPLVPSGNNSIGNLTGAGYSIDTSGFNFNIYKTSGAFAPISKLTASLFSQILFADTLVLANTHIYAMDLRIGNPDVEFRNGLKPTTTTTSYTGTGIWKFTTNNQEIRGFNNGGSIIQQFDCSLIIYGIVLTTGSLDFISATMVLIYTNIINGNDSLSTYKNIGTVYCQTTTQPMAIGVLNCNSAANTWKYNLEGNQEVKGTTYRTLEFGGSGVKKLMGNVVVNVSAGGSWSITGSATIDYNGFTITTI